MRCFALLMGRAGTAAVRGLWWGEENGVRANSAQDGPPSIPPGCEPQTALLRGRRDPHCVIGPVVARGCVCVCGCGCVAGSRALDVRTHQPEGVRARWKTINIKH